MKCDICGNDFPMSEIVSITPIEEGKSINICNICNSKWKSSDGNQKYEMLKQTGMDLNRKKSKKQIGFSKRLKIIAIYVAFIILYSIIYNLLWINGIRMGGIPYAIIFFLLISAAVFCSSKIKK